MAAEADVEAAEALVQHELTRALSVHTRHESDHHLEAIELSIAPTNSQGCGELSHALAAAELELLRLQEDVRSAEAVVRCEATRALVWLREQNVRPFISLCIDLNFVALTAVTPVRLTMLTGGAHWSTPVTPFACRYRRCEFGSKKAGA
jgi:hypothetical protein